MTRVLFHSLTIPPDNVSTGKLVADIANKFSENGQHIEILASTPQYNFDENVFNNFPGSDNGVVNLSNSDNSGVDITSVNLNGSNTITFTKWGDCLQSGTIILNGTREIHIDKVTGYWEIVNS